MIRVLHILHSMNRGGAEAMLMNYYRNIDHSRVQFDFLLTEQNKCLFEDEIESMGGRVYRVPLLRMNNPIPYINGVKSFLIEHLEYRIVHSHTSSKSVVPLWVAKRCRVPVRIAHSHNTKSESGFSGMVRNLLKFPLRYVATDLFACGGDAAKWLYGKAIWNAGKVKILANAIPVERFSYDVLQRNLVRDELMIAEDQLVLGMIARFSSQKNHLFALELVKVLKDRGANLKLLLVGDGELRNVIQDKVKELEIEKEVVMTGVVDDVYKYLQAIDVVLMPSFNEGLPVSLVEAQANGLPCVVSDRVPREADVTGNVDFLPLEVDVWADCLASKMKQGVARDADAVKRVRNAGYDIKIASKELEEWYLNKYNDFG